MSKRKSATKKEPQVFVDFAALSVFVKNDERYKGWICYYNPSKGWILEPPPKRIEKVNKKAA